MIDFHLLDLHRLRALWTWALPAALLVWRRATIRAVVLLRTLKAGSYLFQTRCVVLFGNRYHLPLLLAWVFANHAGRLWGVDRFLSALLFQLDCVVKHKLIVFYRLFGLLYVFIIPPIDVYSLSKGWFRKLVVDSDQIIPSTVTVSWCVSLSAHIIFVRFLCPVITRACETLTHSILNRGHTRSSGYFLRWEILAKLCSLWVLGLRHSEIMHWFDSLNHIVALDVLIGRHAKILVPLGFFFLLLACPALVNAYFGYRQWLGLSLTIWTNAFRDIARSKAWTTTHDGANIPRLSAEVADSLGSLICNVKLRP